MNKHLLTGLMLAGLATAGAHAAEPSLCSRLADEARRAPASTWAQPEPLAGWIQPMRAGGPSPVAAALAHDARWRAQLGASGRPLGVQQLAGAPVFLLEDFGGTAHCQSLWWSRPAPASRCGR